MGCVVAILVLIIIGCAFAINPFLGIGLLAFGLLSIFAIADQR